MQIHRQLVGRIAGLIALMASGMFFGGCVTATVPMTTGLMHNAAQPRCPLGTTRICHVEWASKIYRNQRGYSCSCETR